jgi:hypothetical protein
MPIPLCFFCGGNARIDVIITPPRPLEEHPHVICKNCAGLRDSGEIMIFEVVEADPGCGNIKLREGVWYTGRWVTIDEEIGLMLFASEQQASVSNSKYACLRADNYARANLDKFAKRIMQ